MCDAAFSVSRLFLQMRFAPQNFLSNILSAGTMNYRGTAPPTEDWGSLVGLVTQLCKKSLLILRNFSTDKTVGLSLFLIVLIFSLVSIISIA